MNGELVDFILSEAEYATGKYIKAEQLLMRLHNQNWFQRLFSKGLISQYIHDILQDERSKGRIGGVHRKESLEFTLSFEEIKNLYDWSKTLDIEGFEPITLKASTKSGIGISTVASYQDKIKDITDYNHW